MATYAIVGCWVGFLVYWRLSADAVKPTRERQSLAREFAHRLPVVTGAVLLLSQFRFWGLGHRWLPAAPATLAVGVGWTLLGLLGAVWARRTLGANWSSAVTVKEGHELVRGGPYGWVRNPIYSSMLLMVAGTAVALGRMRDLLALALIFAGFWIKLRQEEAFMLRQFPAEYPLYKRQVKALIPFIL